MTSRHIMPRPNNRVMTMKKHMMIAAVALSLTLVNTAWAGHGNAEEASKKAEEVCAACHGPKGNSVVPNFPRLAGQNESYLQAVLKHYRSKQRSNVIMNGQAEKLTDKEIADLAAYFSQQQGLELKR